MNMKAVALGFALAAMVLPATAAMYAPGTLVPSEFVTLSTKWEPGPNVASVNGSSPTGGPMTPGSATWSIMGAGFADVSTFDPEHSPNLTVAITGLAVPTFTMASYISYFDSILDVWASVSGFDNLGMVTDGGVDAGDAEASDGHLGDIRIGAWEITTSGVLAHAYQPGTEALFGAGGTIAGDMHIDVARTWADDPTDTTGDADFDLYTVALHEFGHSLGLNHSSVFGSVMEPVYAGARRTLTADDIAGIQAIYGLDSVTVPEPSVALLLMAGFGLIYRRRK